MKVTPGFNLYVLRDIAYVELLYKYAIVGLHSQCPSAASSSAFSSNKSPKSHFPSKILNSASGSFPFASLCTPKHLKFHFITTEDGIGSLRVCENLVRKIYGFNPSLTYTPEGLFVLQADRFCLAPLDFENIGGMVTHWWDGLVVSCLEDLLSFEECKFCSRMLCINF